MTGSTDSIRSVDFSNFTYRLPDEMVDPNDKQDSFTLKDGSRPTTQDANGNVVGMGFSLGKVTYADVTGDELEEALVFVSVQTGGSALAGILYVFALDETSPRHLWSITTGDRADKGFRTAYAENRELVIELNDPTNSRGDCCPLQFERTKYSWTNRKFDPKEKEILPIASEK